MKKIFYSILFLSTVLASFNASATVFTFSGGAWSPLTPTQANTDTFLVYDVNASLLITTLASGGTIIVDSLGSLSLNNFTSFDAGSHILVDTNASMTVSGGFFTVTNSSSDFVINGVVTVNSISSFSNVGTVTVGTTGTLVLNVLFFTNAGTLDIDGSLSYLGIGINSGTISGNGTITNTGGVGLPLFNSGTVGGQTGNINTPVSIPNINDPNVVLYTSSSLYPNVSCINKLIVDKNLVVNTNLVVGQLEVRFGKKVTIQGGFSIKVCTAASSTYVGAVENEGTIILEDKSALAQLEPIDNNTSTNGTVSVKRIGQTNLLSYNVWSSPINNALIGGTGLTGTPGIFAASNPCDIYFYDAPTSSWKYDYPMGTSAICSGNSTTINGSGDGVMDLGRGYYIPGTGSATAKSFNGKMNNGSISATTVTLNVSDWALVGNPYPSGLNASKFLVENAALLNGVVYFWDDNLTGGNGGYSQADYATWTFAGGVGTGVGAGSTGGGTGVQPHGVIGVAQGFWVEPIATGTVQFTNTMRSDTNDQFFKSETKIQRLWVGVETPSGIPNNILVAALNEATNGYDSKFDGRKLSGNTHVKLASQIGNEEFAIQAFKTLDAGQTRVIKLSLFTDESGVHTFAEIKRENIPTGMEIFIRDTKLGITHDVKNGAYAVDLIGNKDYNNRFELVFVNNSVATGINEVAKTNFTILTTENGYTLLNNEGINGDIQVLDITGKVIWTKNNVHSTTSVNIELDGVSAGIYIIHVIDNNQRVYSNKLVKS